MLEGDQLRDAGPRLGRHPEVIEEPVAVQGVAEEEGVEALRQQQGVGAGRPDDDTHLDRRESGEGAVRSGERLPPRDEQPEHLLQAVRDRLRVVRQRDLGAVQGRPVPRSRKGHRAAHEAHAVGPHPLHLEDRFRELLLAGGSQPAQVHTGVLGIPPDAPGEEADAEEGILERPADRLRPGRLAELLPPGVEERFQIDHDGVLTGRDEILVVHVRGAQQIEQGEIAPLPLVEAPDLALGGAGSRLDELDPAVVPPLQQPEPVEAGEPLRSGPSQEVLERGFHGDGPGLVDQLQPGIEGRHQHRPAAAVGVSEPAVELDEPPSPPSGANRVRSASWSCVRCLRNSRLTSTQLSTVSAVEPGEHGVLHERFER